MLAFRTDAEKERNKKNLCDTSTKRIGSSEMSMHTHTDGEGMGGQHLEHDEQPGEPAVPIIQRRARVKQCGSTRVHDTRNEDQMHGRRGGGGVCSTSERGMGSRSDRTPLCLMKGNTGFETVIKAANQSVA